MTEQEVKEFLKDIEFICKKHNKSIAHEDYQGGFIIEEYDEDNIEWLNAASYK